MAEIAKFRGCRIWRRPLLQPAVKRKHPQKRLKVGNEHGAEVIVFEKQSGVWIAVEVPRFLTFLRGTRAPEVKLELQKLDLQWRWL